MRNLRREVEAIARIELLRANDEHPLFASNHEGFMVMYEELNEANQEITEANEAAELLMDAVFSDNYETALDHAHKVERLAIEAACEAIQTAAMARKFKDSYYNRLISE